MDHELPAIIQYPVVVDGIASRVLETGEGDNVIVCLHGAGSRADRWRPAIARLASKGYHCYAIDYPGHGLAAKPAGYPYGTDAFGEFVHAYLESLDHQPLVLAGTSIGGLIAGELALRQPDRFSAICVIGAVGLIENEEKPNSSTSGGNIAATGRDGIRAKLEYLVYDDSLVNEDWVSEEWRINSSPGATDALAVLQAANAARPPEAAIGRKLAGLDTPIALFWGKDDLWVPVSNGYAAHEDIGKAPLFVMNDASHAPYYERPDVFVDTFDLFLRDTTRFGTDVHVI